MAVIPEYTLPKGSSGMTLYGTRNDDSTVTFPAMGFSILYNNTSVSTIFSSGNSWIGIGAGTEHITINRRDTSYNNLYYASEMEFGIKVFRVRFEGNSSYSSWGSNNLIWEFSVFEDGVLRLVIEKTPNNASDSFHNPGGNGLSVRFETGKSYIFTPQNENGTNFIVEEGTYIPCQNKYLVVDQEGVKSYVQTEEGSSWVKIADIPISEELFTEFGIDVLPNDLTGLQNQATLFYFTDNPSIVLEKEQYTFEVKEIVTSNPKVILQIEAFQILKDRKIKQIEVVTSEVGGRIRIAFSTDDGMNYYGFSKVTSSFELIDVNDIEDFLQRGIPANDLISINYTELNQRIVDKLSFAYVLDKPTLNDICKLKVVKIKYEE